MRADSLVWAMGSSPPHDCMADFAGWQMRAKPLVPDMD
jgi:hypothetical protein